MAEMHRVAQIMSVGMMLRYSFDMGQAADDIQRAITEVLDEGWRTGDLKDASTPADKVVGTVAMGDLIVQHLRPLSFSTEAVFRSSGK